MPFPSEHAARQADPGDFAQFRRAHPDGFPAGVDVVFGIRDDGTTAIQSVRFDRAKWTAVQALAWLGEHKLKSDAFEAATAKSAMPAPMGRGRKKVQAWRFSSRQRAMADWASVAFAKVDAEKRIVYGVVLDPYIVDAHDDWIPPNEVEATAWGWLEKSRRMRVEHQKDLEAVPVESYVLPYPTPEDYAKAVAGEPHRIWRLKLGSEWVHSGSWVLATRILDAEVWRAVASGDLGAYSIGGFGMRREVGKVPMPEIEVLTIEAPAA